VGGYPERFGTPLDTFHGQNIERTKFWPCAMITTMTHDTKRSEDVRARINVLSEIPEEWRQGLLRWKRINQKKKSTLEGQRVPDLNEEYLLYQTLVGAWPLPLANETDFDRFKKRIQEYMLKAAREAKVNTSWISPNLSYEEALVTFVDAVLSRSEDNLFLKEFETFQRKVSYFGMFNSLSQTLLKITAPGIPDFYQGTEIWELSLVDPDNRRPVDFHLRKERLEALKEKMVASESNLPEFATNLVREWPNGLIKLYVTFQTLNDRRKNPLLFRDGVYLPMAGEGNRRDHLCAFSRQRDEEAVMVVVPRGLAGLIKGPDEMPLGKAIWEGSWVLIPEEVTGDAFYNIFTGETLRRMEREGQGALPLDQVFAHFPVAMLKKV
jgi:(1->4)-alpha-D-glucan 1-alpha-D-glucosylmutase